MHFGISGGKGGGGVRTWKPSMVWYGYFLELPLAWGKEGDNYYVYSGVH